MEAGTWLNQYKHAFTHVGYHDKFDHALLVKRRSAGKMSPSTPALIGTDMDSSGT